MANIEVSAAIDNLLKSTPSTTVTTVAALTALGAATTGNASIVAADLAPNAVTEAKILDGAVTVGKIGALAVTDAKLAANAVTADKILAGAVTAAKITDATLTIAKTNGLQAALDAKQTTLISGTNIKSVNGTTLLGSGDVAVTGSDVFDVTTAPYNAIGDGRLIDTFLNTSGVATQGASMTSGSAVVTVTGGTFAAGDVGKYICIQGVGTLPTGTITATAGVITAVTLSTTGSVGAYPANATIDFEVESLGTANPPTSEPIASASQASDIVTLVFASPHGFTTGDLVDVSGITGSTGTTPNGRFTITVTSVTQITYALVGSLGTYGVSSATANGVAIAGVNGVLRMTTDANGQAATLTIVNGGTLYANPKLVFPETGLIGTITAYTNSTTVTISRVAPSTFTLKPCFFGTDNSVAIQAALDAALASPTIKTVYIPTGIFLCNIQTYADIRLTGAGGGIGLANNLTFAGQVVNTRPQTNPTVLMPAVGYKPVIYAANGGGVISRMCIHGAPSLMNNIGVKIGSAYGSGFVSLGFLMNQVNLCGFKYALAAARIADTMLENISATYCGIVFYLTQPDENRYTDQTTINCCYGNYIRDYFVYCSGGKTITMISCDYTLSGPVARVKNGTKLVVISLNSENSPIFYPSAATQTDNDLFQIVGGASLVIHALRLANPSGWTNGAVIKEDLNRTNAAANISVFASDSGGSGMYRTNGSKYPFLLPKGAVISRWDSGFTTKIMSEASTRAYAGAGKMGRFKNWEEYFPAAPPYNRMVTGATQLTDVVTLTTLSPHKLIAGMQIVVEGIGYASGTNPNGTFLVATALTSTTLTYSLTGSAGSYTTNGKSFVTNEGYAFGNAFCITNIGATQFLKPLDLNGYGVGISNSQLYFRGYNNNPANTGIRLAQEYPSIYNTDQWELKFDLQSQTLTNYPLIRFGMYDLTSTSLTPSNGIGIKIVNAAATEPNIFLEFVVNGVSTSQDTGFKLGSSRRVLVLSKSGSQITLSLHGSAQSGYNPVAQYIWNQSVSNTSLYYSPSIYLGNSTTTFMEMYVNSIKYQELNTDLL